MSRPVLFRIAVPVLVPLAAIVSGCQNMGMRPGPISYWGAPADQRVLEDDPPQAENEVFSAAQQRLTLRAAVNETVALQLAIRAKVDGQRVINLRATELRGAAGSIPSRAVRLYRIAAIEVVDYPGWFSLRTSLAAVPRRYPDALVPLAPRSNALPVSLSTARNTLFWLDLTIPPGTAAGHYTASLLVATGPAAQMSIPLEVEVLPFALPDQVPIAALVPLDMRTLVAQHIQVDGRAYRPERFVADDPMYPKAMGVLDAAMKTLRAHRCEGIVTDAYPLREATADGSLQFDWGDYDDRFAAYIDGSAFEDRLPTPFWPLPVDQNFPDPAYYGGEQTDAYRQALQQSAREALRHFAERGWLDRHVCLWLTGPLTETSPAAAYEAVASVAADLRPIEPPVRIGCDLPPFSLAAFGWPDFAFRDLHGTVGCWVPPARYVDPQAIASAGADLWQWFQPDEPPYSGSIALVSPPQDVRSIAWQADRWGVSAFWLAGALDWPETALDARALARLPGDVRWLLYPGTPFGLDEPIPSVRLKHLRRGLEDIQYLWLLRQQNRPAIARLIAESLFKFGGKDAYDEQYADGRAYGWVRDPAIWRLGRALLATELEHVAARTPEEPFEQFRQRFDWQRFLEATRQVHAWCAGVRVRPAEAHEQGLGVVASVRVLNQTGDRHVATVDAASLPSGWQMPDSPPVVEVAPGDVARAAMALRPPPDDLAGDTNGLVALPLQVALDDARTLPVAGRLAVLRAQRLQRPLVIDGRLDDWPPAATDVAGDFVLVGAQDVRKEGLATADRPTQSTSSFVVYDDQALYVAFNCRQEPLDSLTMTKSNYVRYEVTRPVGEDLVEIILDPGARATGPGGLYHIVVKANGAVIAERGIGCEPPISRSRPWSAGIRAAVDTTSMAGHWYVELRIPWAAFDADVRKAAVWGVNFTRRCEALDEYATWSAARWNVYTPTTLGNLIFPDDR